MHRTITPVAQSPVYTAVVVLSPSLSWRVLRLQVPHGHGYMHTKLLSLQSHYHIRSYIHIYIAYTRWLRWHCFMTELRAYKMRENMQANIDKHTTLEATELMPMNDHFFPPE